MTVAAQGATGRVTSPACASWRTRETWCRSQRTRWTWTWRRCASCTTRWTWGAKTRSRRWCVRPCRAQWSCYKTTTSCSGNTCSSREVWHDAEQLFKWNITGNSWHKQLSRLTTDFYKKLIKIVLVILIKHKCFVRQLLCS